MSVPKVMPSPRQMIHRYFCPSAGQCRFRERNTGAGAQCRMLDELLDFNDEQLLHAKARELDEEMCQIATGRRGASIAAGLFRAIELVEPFEKMGGFADDLETHVHPGENRPDCPACVAGREHYHRKSDGSLVIVPTEGDIK